MNNFAFVGFSRIYLVITKCIVQEAKSPVKISSGSVARRGLISALKGVATQPAARRRGGRRHNFTIGGREIRSAVSRPGAPVFHLTRTARETVPLTGGNGRPETIAVPPAPQEPGTRRPRRFSSHHPGQSTATERATQNRRPDRGLSRFSLISR
jgi:hypothetical protein